MSAVATKPEIKTDYRTDAQKALDEATELVRQMGSYDAKWQMLARVQLACAKAIIASQPKAPYRAPSQDAKA